MLTQLPEDSGMVRSGWRRLNFSLSGRTFCEKCSWGWVSPTGMAPVVFAHWVLLCGRVSFNSGGLKYWGGDLMCLGCVLKLS